VAPPEPQRDALREALRPEPGGLSLDEVGKQASATDPGARVSDAEARAASARVDQAIAAYFPTARLVASYTRLSDVDNTFDVGIPGAPAVEFPVILDNWALIASLEIPLSDYFTRVTQAYAAAESDVDAKTLDADAKRRQAAVNAKVAYLSWIRARGRRVVAKLAVEQSRRHLEDARVTLRAGLISPADLQRLEAQLAQIEHLARSAGAFEGLAGQQLQTALHEGGKRPLRIGVDVLEPPPLPPERDLPKLQEEALRNRTELKALARAEATLESAEDIARAGHYPRLTAFGDLTYANPNPRIFPQREEWNMTWQVGLRATWVINETFSTFGATAERRAQVLAVREQRQALEDGIRMAVASAYYDARTANSAVEAAKQRERAAAASLKARRMLFRGGKATATDIVDAETELTQARLQRVDAHVDAIAAKVRLEHAIGKS
jgi:outer membrane protein TolC